MNDSSTPSLITDTDFPTPQGALPVWSKVFTKPGEKTFLEILEHPEAKAKSAYLWVFLAGTFSGLISALARFIVTMIGVRQLMPEFGEVPGMSGIFGAAGLLGALCSAPLTGLFTLLSFMLSVAIIHGTAKFLGGQGTFDRMAYSFGAVVAPLTLISAVLVPLTSYHTWHSASCPCW